jgi:hypothetical protein
MSGVYAKNIPETEFQIQKCMTWPSLLPQNVQERSRLKCQVFVDVVENDDDDDDDDDIDDDDDNAAVGAKPRSPTLCYLLPVENTPTVVLLCRSRNQV